MIWNFKLDNYCHLWKVTVFGALKLPEAVESSSKTCNFQEEIQRHEVMSVRGKKTQAKTFINQNPEKKWLYSNSGEEDLGINR